MEFNAVIKFGKVACCRIILKGSRALSNFEWLQCYSLIFKGCCEVV